MNFFCEWQLGVLRGNQSDCKGCFLLHTNWSMLIAQMKNEIFSLNANAVNAAQ